MAPFQFDFAADEDVQAFNRAVVVQAVAVRVPRRFVTLPGLVLDVAFDVPLVEMAVIVQRAVSRIGAYPFGEAAVQSREPVDDVRESVDVVPFLGDVIGEHVSHYHEELDVVGGVHVTAQPGIIIGLEGHRGGVAVRFAIRFASRPARLLLLLAFHHLAQQRGQGSVELADREGLEPATRYKNTFPHKIYISNIRICTPLVLLLPKFASCFCRILLFWTS